MEIISPNGDVVGRFSEAYALVIGESNYTNGWRRLPGVSEDVAAVKQLFEECGFVVETIQDANSSKLRNGIMNFLDNYGYNKDARIIIYFAGHGATLILETNSKMGYIVPVDAPLPGHNEIAFKRSALPMNQFSAWAKAYDARHILFIFDSCFSGTVFRSTTQLPPAIDRLINQPVRQFITAGEADEEVPDESVFRRQLEAGLRHGLADMNKDGYVSGTELGLYLYNTVSNYTDGKQNPMQGKLNDPNLDKGDFIFAVGTWNQPSAEGGSVTVESDISGEIYIDGKPTARRIKTGGTETITNVSTGYTEVAVREDNGAIVKAPQAVMVRQGQTATIVIECPVPEGLAFELVEGKSIIITKYSGNAATVHIPGRIQGLLLTAIGENAFEECSSLIGVTMPSSVTDIGACAFYKCSSLARISIPSSVMTIRKSTLSGCSSLADVAIPYSIAEIETLAFANCSGLTSITIPSSVTVIGMYAFAKCSGLKSVTIPSSVTVISAFMFMDCSSLASVSIPSSVTNIDLAAFRGCSSLAYITIPSSVTRLAADAFDNCSNLTEITVDNRNQKYASIDGVLFDKNIRTIIAYPAGKKAVTYAIPSSVAVIYHFAFSYCPSLTGLTIPPSVTAIGAGIFVNCRSLTSVTVSRRTFVSKEAFPDSTRICYSD